MISAPAPPHSVGGGGDIRTGGSLTEIRIRGAEANHTLLFVDGIKIDDPGFGRHAPVRNPERGPRVAIEVVRGPQSALWGSEAVGGVIAVNGVDDVPGASAKAEGGSFGLLRASASGALATSRASVAGAVGFQRATGSTALPGPATRTAIAISRAGCAAPGTRAPMSRSEPRRSA